LILFSDLLPDPVFVHMQKSLSLQNSNFVFKMGEISDILNAMCNDVDHQARSQALSTLGNVAILMGGSVVATHLYCISSFMSSLLIGTRDTVGTVREAAYKSLSDLVLVAGSSFVLLGEVLSAEMFCVSGELFGCIHAGCLDSKLTVRMSAMFAISSLLLYLIKMCCVLDTSAANEVVDRCFQILTDLLDSSLEICLMMLTSENNNDKLFPNVIHSLAIICYGVIILSPHVLLTKSVNTLKHVLWILCYEVMLEDKARYSSISSAFNADRAYFLSEEEMQKISHCIVDSSNKTQYHIKQRLILTTSQTLAIILFAIQTLTMTHIKKIQDTQIEKELLGCLRSHTLVIMPVLLQHGGFETALLAGKGLLSTLLFYRFHDDTWLTVADLTVIFDATLYKIIDKKHPKYTDEVLLAILYFYLIPSQVSGGGVCVEDVVLASLLRFTDDSTNLISVADWFKVCFIHIHPKISSLIFLFRECHTSLDALL
jgi:hypothetical protein